MIPIVLDHGSGIIKAGYSGFNNPVELFPSIVSHPRFDDGLHPHFEKTKYYGDEIKSYGHTNRGERLYPIKNGIVTNWDDLEDIWRYTFYRKMGAHTKDHKIFLTESMFNSNENRQKMAEIIFENFSFEGMWLGDQSKLSLYSSGRTSGLIIDSGYKKTNIVSVLNSTVEMVNYLDIGGRDITDYMKWLLNASPYFEHYYSSNSAKFEYINRIKENLGYVAYDYHSEMINSSDLSYELPDGKRITHGSELFNCVEPLFKPPIMYRDSLGIHDLIYDSIQQCDPINHSLLYNNIVLAGGNSMFPGIKERIHRELTNLEQNANIQIIAQSWRDYAAWIGGSLISSFSNSNDWILSKLEYEEFGYGIRWSQKII